MPAVRKKPGLFDNPGFFCPRNSLIQQCLTRRAGAGKLPGMDSGDHLFFWAIIGILCLFDLLLYIGLRDMAAAIRQQIEIFGLYVNDRRDDHIVLAEGLRRVEAKVDHQSQGIEALRRIIGLRKHEQAPIEPGDDEHRHP
jgi:hypothetical protein